MSATLQTAVQNSVASENIAMKSPGAHRVVTYKPGQEIYAEGDAVNKWYQVVTGAVRVRRLLSDGQRQVVSVHLSGEVFGFEAGSTHGFFAEAIAKTSLAVCERPPMEEHSTEVLDVALRVAPGGGQRQGKLEIQP